MMRVGDDIVSPAVLDFLGDDDEIPACTRQIYGNDYASLGKRPCYGMGDALLIGGIGKGGENPPRLGLCVRNSRHIFRGVVPEGNNDVEI
jgi:hypothetical protein